MSERCEQCGTPMVDDSFDAPYGGTSHEVVSWLYQCDWPRCGDDEEGEEDDNDG